MNPDVVVCMQTDNIQTNIVQYTDPVQLYHNAAGVMTSLDTLKALVEAKKKEIKDAGLEVYNIAE